MSFGDGIAPAGAGLLGTIWAAIEPNNDAFDRVEVVGTTIGTLADGETRTAELVLTSADEFTERFSADVDAFREAYRPEAQASEFIEELDARFAEVVRSAA